MSVIYRELVFLYTRIHDELVYYREAMLFRKVINYVFSIFSSRLKL